MATTAQLEDPDRRTAQVVGAAVIVASLCSLIYELLISTTASYFLGGAVTNFSLTIGLYMAAMGFGAHLTGGMTGQLPGRFVTIEILLGLLGGLSVPLLYFVWAMDWPFYPVFIGLVLAIGGLTGCEVPLLARILENRFDLRENLARVLSLDYVGALCATLAFPFLLLPWLGIFTGSLVTGVLNTLVGLGVLWHFGAAIPNARRGVYALAGTALLLSLMAGGSSWLLAAWRVHAYEDPVVHSEQTPYQRIVMTRFRNDLRLFLDGNLQFSSRDEYRYHEPLVHIPVAQTQGTIDVLILGGGDGLAAEEALEHERVRSIDIIDLDPAMLALARRHDALTELNDGALDDPRVDARAGDAFQFLHDTDQEYDLVIADLPDPNNVSLARLYSRSFYQAARGVLDRDGVFVTQATSPQFAGRAFRIIEATTRGAGFKQVAPYHAHIPSFGEWGFVMARKGNQALDKRPDLGQAQTEYLTAAGVPAMFRLPPDIPPASEGEVSTLDEPVVLDAYLAGWKYWG